MTTAMIILHGEGEVQLIQMNKTLPLPPLLKKSTKKTPKPKKQNQNEKIKLTTHQLLYDSS